MSHVRHFHNVTRATLSQCHMCDSVTCATVSQCHTHKHTVLTVNLLQYTTQTALTSVTIHRHTCDSVTMSHVSQCHMRDSVTMSHTCHSVTHMTVSHAWQCHMSQCLTCDSVTMSHVSQCHNVTYTNTQYLLWISYIHSTNCTDICHTPVSNNEIDPFRHSLLCTQLLTFTNLLSINLGYVSPEPTICLITLTYWPVNKNNL